MGDSSHGVSAQIRVAIWAERRLGLDISAIGRSGFDRKDTCTLQLGGKNLFYSITIDGGFTFFYAQQMDTGDPLEHIVTVGDTRDGWDILCRLLEALEHSGISSLHPRPLHVGSETGAGAFVIA